MLLSNAFLCSSEAFVSNSHTMHAQTPSMLNAMQINEPSLLCALMSKADDSHLTSFIL